jgi:hypothetical protein
MRSGRPAIAVSAQQADPLSWFIGRLVPLTFAALAVLYGAFSIAWSWTATAVPALQLLALALVGTSGLLVHVLTRPMRSVLTWRWASLALLLTVAGMVVSAAGYAGDDIPVERWWGSAALALAIAALSPYLPTWQLLALGGGATAIATVASTLLLHPIAPDAGPVVGGIVVGYPAALAVVAGAVFAYSVVRATLPIVRAPSGAILIGDDVRDQVADELERVTLARLTARAAPFLAGVADAGRITPADRALAGQLARRLRDELVTQSNLSWLDSVAAGSRMVVVDPDRRARDMDAAQRTALRAMLDAILATPGTDAGSLLIDLRAAPDGATAVAVSLDMALPEGRRIMHLAPYVLTLGTAVDDLTVDSAEHLRLSFRVPARDAR